MRGRVAWEGTFALVIACANKRGARVQTCCAGAMPTHSADAEFVQQKADDAASVTVAILAQGTFRFMLLCRPFKCLRNAFCQRITRPCRNSKLLALNTTKLLTNARVLHTCTLNKGSKQRLPLVSLPAQPLAGTLRAGDMSRIQTVTDPQKNIRRRLPRRTNPLRASPESENVLVVGRAVSAGAPATLIIKVLCRPSALRLVERQPTHFALCASGKGQYRPRGTCRQSGLVSLAAWAQQSFALVRGLKRDAL